MKSLVVGISDCKVSNDQESTLITYALGSCIAVVLYDPATKVGGLLHYMLPESALDVQKAQENPYMFADTGIKALLKEVAANGAQARRMVVRLAGGAQVLDSQGVFQIGKRNYLAGAPDPVEGRGVDFGRSRRRRGFADHASGCGHRADVDPGSRRSRKRASAKPVAEESNGRGLMQCRFL